MISLIAAVAKNGVIGKSGTLPWDLPDDLQYFRNVTAGHAVIMGRKTHEAIGRPLPKRLNIIITRHKDYSAPGCVVVGSLAEALAKVPPEESETFIIGGAEIFKEALPELADRLYLTEIHADVDGDTYFPEFDRSKWREISRKEGIVDEKNTLPHTFLTYERA